MTRETRSSVELPTEEIQKVLPGVSPLKAINTLPGVIYETADPWGNNEQNLSLFVHGFSTQQLGYTLDGVPLGDQQYGNYNSLSVSRAVTSENVSRVNLSSGAGSLGVASISNLGGAIETYSRDPAASREIQPAPDGGQLPHHAHLPDAYDTGDLGQGQQRLHFLPAPGRQGLGLQRPPARRPGQSEVRPRRRARQAHALRRLAVEVRTERGRHRVRQPADRRGRRLLPPTPGPSTTRTSRPAPPA